ncbi:hypothetical protein [Streptomyces sp. VB1]|uniref:hypothetical protein n=1 Tax=Streptomyces sp. VB1 TaxID=2986803 RepID=UPI002242143B|nr:hypothetical protein [Streptomyces sp. VB1]UZI32779.1 hypothetical protein OH133_34435 [Streptomyces sp. VB1]
MRQRLLDRGLKVSLSTLSYWQSGRSQPERTSSLAAVTALETILQLPPGALRSQLGPHRPRGGLATAPQVSAALQHTYGEEAQPRLALGEDFVSLNADVRQLVMDTTVRLDASRCQRVISARIVVRALRSGVEGFIDVCTQRESTTRPPDVVVRFGTLDNVRYIPHLRTTVVQILFGRPLERNETAIIDYDLVFGPGEELTASYEHNFPPGRRESLVHIVFDPQALPAYCRRYYRSAYGAEETRAARITLDASHSVHTLTTGSPTGLHGIAWDWPV